MGSILYEEDIVEQWRTLLQDSQSKILIHLEKQLENYLIFLLIRFINKPEIAHHTSTIGLDFLNCHNEHSLYLGQQYHKKLQSIGDNCLLFSGLFPGRAQRRGSNLSYIVKIGQTAYNALAPSNPLYEHLSFSFTALMDVLLNLRADSDYNTIDLFQALDLWENTHSQYAYQLLHTLKKTPH